LLTERQLEVVLAVVYEYIRTGEPIGSRTLSRGHLKGRSAATIRNEMSDLEEMEFLSQPHPSAGRVPTPKAYRVYVDAIMQRHRSFPLPRQRWSGELRDRRDDVEEALSYATRLLGKVTRYVGVAALGPVKDIVLQRVEFVRVAHAEVLVLVVLKAGLIHHRVIKLPCDMTQEALDDLSRKISTMAVDRPWKDVRGALHSYVEGALERYAENCRSALTEMDGILQSRPYQFFTGGAGNILGLPDFGDLGKLQAIMAVLDEDASIADLVERCSADSGLCVTIGDENPVFQMRDCSVVMASAETGGRKAVIGLIGPVRMDYEHSITVLESIIQSLSGQEGKQEGTT